MPLVLTANTVPLPKLPPLNAVPYRVLPDKINPSNGLAPSLPPVKLYRFVKPVPSVLMANTMPFSELPPYVAVPYGVLPSTPMARVDGEHHAIFRTAAIRCRPIQGFAR